MDVRHQSTELDSNNHRACSSVKNRAFSLTTFLLAEEQLNPGPKASIDR